MSCSEQRAATVPPRLLACVPPHLPHSNFSMACTVASICSQTTQCPSEACYNSCGTMLGAHCEHVMQ
eukprot:4361333-Amphidinium_carterae.1